jgi:hypothetical protein
LLEGVVIGRVERRLDVVTGVVVESVGLIGPFPKAVDVSGVSEVRSERWGFAVS